MPKLPPQCRWIGHAFGHPTRFKPWYPPIPRNYEPIEAVPELFGAEAYALRFCLYDDCDAFQVIDYGGKAVSPDDDRYARAQEVLGFPDLQP